MKVNSSCTSSVSTPSETRLAQARDGFGPVRTDWLKRAEGLGGMVRVSPGGVAIEGIFDAHGTDLIMSNQSVDRTTYDGIQARAVASAGENPDFAL